MGPGEGIGGWLRAVSRLWDDREAYAAAVESAELQGADPAVGSQAVAGAFERLLAPMVALGVV